MSALLVVGEVVTDVVARHRSPLAPATDTAARIRTLPGGAGANAACWAARSGCADVRLLARVGTDQASWHEERLRSAAVRPLLVADGDAPTATVVALVDAAAERTLVTDSGAALRLSPADWSPRLLDGVRHLHLSGYLFFAATSRETVSLAMAAARERGIPVSVDPASAGFIAELGVDRFLAAVRGADVLLPNADEATLLTGLPGAADAAVKLSRHFPLVPVTLGADGALVAAAGEVVARVPAPSVRAVDSTGAGDAFTGAFLAARLSGGDPAAAARAGCEAGARAVTRVGGRPPGE
ncbi:carbohydrate kinase family protein [Streptomyces sp. SP18CS02]|uniref:carbohydrate kinase family protein n=1 Tax=Streptomyces sp. SP18CS02 TaxID=3002531 RepID=UPI002E7A134E|nr:PfkB family carbohydrate kinase [Streptomyces sp. SP18CS02]MEE1754948.1 PfkB family carbohydrate kinase [Streptomyces sp. SP18CS02]